MTKSDEPPLLLVLSILQGRNIPSIQNNNFIVDVKLANEQLSTDPVPHTNPTTGFEINSELAWQMTKKTLLAHRLKRTPLKLITFSHDTLNNSRRPTGHLILDLRSLPFPETLVELNKNKNQKIEELDALQPRWCPILNSSYNKVQKSLVPELLVKLTIESDEFPIEQPEERKKETGKQIKNQAQLNQNQKSAQKATKNFIQIGTSQRSNQEFYTLTLKHSKITNILDLIRTNAHIQLVDNAKLFIFTTLFKKEIKFPEFDIVNERSEGVLEICKIKLRGNIHELNKELVNAPPLQLHICCGERSLGAAEIKINNLINVSHLKSDYKIFPPLKALENAEKLDSYISAEVLLEGKGVNNKQGNNGGITGIDLSKKQKMLVQQKNAITQIAGNPVTLDSNITSNAAANLDENLPQTSSTHEKKKVSPPRPQAGQAEQAPQQPQLLKPPTQKLKTTSRVTFIVVVDSISDLVSPFSADMHLRYNYSYISNENFSTKPFKVDINHNSRIYINFTRKNHFAAPIGQLLENFKTTPLEFQLWSESLLVGRSFLKLDFGRNPDIIGEDYPPGGSEGKTAFHCFSNSCSVPIVAGTGNSEIGRINCLISFKNFDPEMAVPPFVKEEQGDRESQTNTNNKSKQKPADQMEDIRNNPEYKTALELEFWKETKKKEYLDELKKLKTGQINELTDQFKKRELDRESGYRKKLLEYEHLEKQLKSGLVDLEEREKLISSQEKELTEMRDNLVSDKQRFTLDQKAAIDRVKKEFSHELSLERKTNANLTEEISGRASKLKLATLETEKLKKTIEKLNSEFNVRPDVKFENENKILSSEKSELTIKLENSIKSKNYYKSQWSKCLQELAKIKEENQENERHQIQKEAEELKILKKKLLLNSEQNRILNAQKELNGLNVNLTTDLSERQLNLEYDRLHGTQSQSNNVTTATTNIQNNGSGDATGRSINPLADIINDPINQHAARLIAEREALMATGAYNVGDLVIRQLDGRIKEAL